MATISIKRILLLSTILLTSLSSRAQNQLEEYISIGLQNNIVLKEKDISLQKSVTALKEAKTLFLSSINFIGNYQTAEGGGLLLFLQGIC